MFGTTFIASLAIAVTLRLGKRIADSTSVTTNTEMIIEIDYTHDLTHQSETTSPSIVKRLVVSGHKVVLTRAFIQCTTNTQNY